MGNTQTLAHTPPPSAPAGELHQEEEERGYFSGNQEFTCEICIEPTSIPDKKFRNNNKCAHPFCTDCVIKYIRVKLEDDNAGHIKCPALNCDHSLDPFSCAQLIGPSLFLRWCDVLCEEAIMGFEKCYCPYRNCNVLILNECGGNLRKSKCPNCRKFFCFQCKRAWHAGFGCEESGELRDRNDMAFGRLVEQKNWMRCPLCRHFVELLEGCRIVKCSTTGALEGTNYLATGNLVSLSEQQLVDCDHECDPDEKDSCDSGCSGGLMNSALEYTLKSGGLMQEEDYPYTGTDRGACKFDKSKIAAKVANFSVVTLDEEQIAANLVKNGPLAVAINAVFMQTYIGGVSCPFICSKRLDHGVLLVGYGAAGYSPIRLKEKPYWIIKNSWGENWGEKGYYKICQGHNVCGVDSLVSTVAAVSISQ